jgi:hypothetical protein
MLKTPPDPRRPGLEAPAARRRLAPAAAGGWLAAAGAAGTALAGPLPAAAHGLGQPYELPVPLGLYLGGAGLAVGLSFLLMAWFLRRGAPSVDRTVELDGPLARRVLTGPVPRWTVRLGALAAFVLLLAAGLFGAQQPFKNITPIAVWVLWWVGFTYVAAFVGDLWPVVNPWATVYDLVRGERPPERPRVTLPARWGVAPAVLAFVIFAAMELAWPQSEVPRALAFAMLAYSAFTWIAMAVFGRDVWLARGELFSVYFAVLGRFAPLAVTAGNPHRGLVARPFAVGLLVDRPVSRMMTAFVLLMLASVTFDGLIETPLWGAVLHEVRDRLAGAPLASWSDDALAAIAWAVFATLFALLYGVVARAMAWAAGEAASRRDLGGWFVLTLVPIGIAYHLAHYHSLLLVAGQYAIPLLSDPFGWGWDLLGTTLYRVDFSIVDAASIWYLSVGAIVLGHVVAVYLAHVMALRVYGSARPALRSQIPMLVLMVYYTMSSLWILSQPIVKTGGQPG